MSNHIFKAEKKNATYMVKGPMGKGLGLTSDSKGHHVVFAAGTGIFVFTDLVARIMLESLNVIAGPDKKVHENFCLHLYASF